MTFIIREQIRVKGVVFLKKKIVADHVGTGVMMEGIGEVREAVAKAFGGIVYRSPKTDIPDFNASNDPSPIVLEVFIISLKPRGDNRLGRVLYYIFCEPSDQPFLTKQNAVQPYLPG